MIGYFRITKESSVAAGVRRIEACVGKPAEAFARGQEAQAEEAALLLKVTPAKMPERIGQLVEENQLLKQQIRSLKHSHLKQLAKELASKVEKSGSFLFWPKLSQWIAKIY